MHVRPATRDDLDLAVRWAAAEGWDPAPGDADAFWAADPGGFWVGEQDGEIVATLSLVRASPAFGFVGFYIVRPDHRGRGLGHAIWREVVDAAPIATLGLDGVVDQQSAYEQSGFVLAYRTLRYAGTPPPPDGTEPVAVVDARALPRDELVAFDAAHVPAPRPAFLERWLAPPERRALAVRGADGELAAFGLARAATGLHRVGPLHARDRETATALLRALAAGDPIAIDVPLANADAVALAEDLGLEPVFETVRMYRGPDPGLPVDRIYGVTSLELG